MLLSHVYGSAGVTIVDVLVDTLFSKQGKQQYPHRLGEYGVLAIRTQVFDITKLAAFNRQRGGLVIIHGADKRLATAPERIRVSNVKKDGRSLRRACGTVSTCFNNITRRQAH